MNIFARCLIFAVAGIAGATVGWPAVDAVPSSVRARFGSSARPVEERQNDGSIDGQALSHGPDLARSGRMLEFTLPETENRPRPITIIQAGTTLNRAIGDLASIGGLGYSPSPAIKEALVETAQIPEDSPITMINTLIAPYGYRALARNSIVQVFGRAIDSTLAPSVLTYRLKHVRFGSIADSPRGSLSGDISSSSGSSGSSGSSSSESSSSKSGGSAGGAQVLPPQDLVAKDISEFFTKIGSITLSGRGSSIVYDPRTRTVTARDLPPYLEVLRQYLDDFDKPQRKVVVHMQIVSVSHSPTRNQGVDYSGLLSAVNVSIGQTTGGNSNVVASAAGSVLSSVGAMTFQGFNSPGRSNLALSVPELSATLNLLRKYADVDLVQETFLVAQDGMAVHKFVGRKLFIVVPGTQATGVGTASAAQTYQPLVGDTVTFHPEVADDGEITASFKLESALEAEKSSYGGQLYPQFLMNDTQQFLTARDGQTVMLSGYLKDQTQVTRNDLPILGDIPIIGPRLFGNTQTSRTRTVTLFLLTMHIIEPGDGRDEDRVRNVAVERFKKDASEVNGYIYPEQSMRPSVTGMDDGTPKKSDWRKRKSVEDVTSSPLSDRNYKQGEVTNGTTPTTAAADASDPTIHLIRRDD